MLQTVQKIPVDLSSAWDFFSRPENLNAITPEKLGFKIRSGLYGETMYAGQIIEYTVKPILGIALYWMTEITHVQDKVYFVDEQRFGPYSLWHHQHHYKQIKDGIEMTDIVHYKIPFWFVGDVANALFVQKQLKYIFEYRHQAIKEKYGTYDAGECVIRFR
jgi:ligand-binding SRPBCC domain-containing protein